MSRHRPQPVDIEQSNPSPDARSGAPDPIPNPVPVYTFVIYDHDKGTTVIYPRMATLRTIANMRGKVNEDSAWIVDESDLDVEGFLVESPREP